MVSVIDSWFGMIDMAAIITIATTMPEAIPIIFLSTPMDKEKKVKKL